ncbi:MAG: hypothetical protein AAF721_22695 [Myxococcota bacterium]
MKLSILSGLALLGLVGACTVAVDGERGAADDRQPLGKADNIGSCQGPDDTDFCGGKSEGSCYCDEACVKFGDCCGDVSAVCEGDGIEPGELCLSDNHCTADQVCDHTECHSNCGPGQICPAVCWGECVDDGGIPGDCGDGTPGLCAAIAPECPEGTASFIVNHCWGPCVDPETCEPPVDPVEPCGDGTVAVCEILVSPCEDGLVREVIGGCFGECVDPVTCEPPVDPIVPCGDGTFPICEVVVAPCEDGLVREVENGCFGECVDPATCEPPAPSCDEVVEEFLTETAEIRSCNVDADCGQVLSGTSCGCTRNWVARTDADVDAWEDMRQDVFDAGCNIPGGISTCDCPAADGFACEDNICTWNYL